MKITSEDLAFAGLVLITLALCGIGLYYNDTNQLLAALVMVIFTAVVVLLPEKYDRRLEPEEKPSDLLDLVEEQEKEAEELDEACSLVEQTMENLQQEQAGVSVSDVIEDKAIKKCSCGSEEFLAGPEGGLAQNIKCAKCGKQYNDTPFGLEPIEEKKQE